MTKRASPESVRRPRFAPLITAAACFLLGYQATLSQVLIIREFLVVFFGNELCLGVIFSSWFIGVAVGAFVAWRVTDKSRNPLSVFAAIELFFPLLLLGLLPLIRVARTWLGAQPGELIPLPRLVAATGLMVAPIGLLVGLAFPFACCALRFVREKNGKSEGTVQSIGWAYVLESFGSLVAGAVFSFVLVPRFSAPEVIFISIIIVSACVFLMMLSPVSRLRSNTVLAVCSGIVLIVATFLFASGLPDRLNARTVLARWRSMGQRLELVASRDSKYQNLALGVQEEQFSLFLNGQYAFSFPDPFIPAQEAHLFMSEHPEPQRVLVIGGTPGMLKEILRHPVLLVDYLEIDPQALKIIEPHLPLAEKESLADRRVNVFYEDGRHFIKRHRGERRYDLVILGLPDPSTAMLNRFYTRELFAEVKGVLRPGGVVVSGISSTSTYFGEEMKSFAGSLFKTMRGSFDYLAIAPGETNYFFASDSPNVVTENTNVLAERYESRQIQSQYFSKYLFSSIFIPERVQFTWDSFEGAENLRINTDDTPVTYFFSLVLWSRYSGGKFGPLLLALSKLSFSWTVVPVILAFGVAAALLWHRSGDPGKTGRVLALTAIGTTGAAAMAFDLAALYAYQNTYGYLYQEIGLVVAMFMMGLAVGGISTTRHLKERVTGCAVLLLVLEIGIAAFALALPGLLHVAASKPFFLMIVFAAGGITGAEFPVANAVFLEAGGRIGSSAALTESMDHIGAAAGAFLTGVLLIPLFGTLKTCVFLSLLNALSAALVVLWLVKVKRRRTA